VRAHPPEVLRAYIAARVERESLVSVSAIPVTVLRPWYVLGAGHRWPNLLIPFYAVLRRIPATRESAERLGLVTLDAMKAAVVRVIEAPPASSVRIVEVPEIRRTQLL